MIAAKKQELLGLHVVGIPRPVHRRLATEAYDNRKSMSAYALQLIARGLGMENEVEIPKRGSKKASAESSEPSESDGMSIDDLVEAIE